ncbi:MAG: polyprenyl synthetase family protein [Candidatus Kapaibacterium sp.]
MRTKNQITENIINEVNNKLMEIGKDINTARLKDSYKYLISNGGKRFRPLITTLSCAMFTSDYLLAVNQGTAIELLHNFTLVHDDIMDKSPLRRGKETIYQKFDDTTAILLGDLILGLSCKRLKIGLEPMQGMKAMNVFNSGLVEVCDGQGYDLDFETRDDITLEEYDMMIERKTGSLIKVSFVIGGITGNATDEELDKLSIVGYELGKAFQLQDDLLDIIGEQKEFGKKTGQDIIEGKKTYLIIKARERAEKQEHLELLDKFFKNSGLDEKEVPKMKALFEELGIIDDVRNLINEKFEFVFSMIREIRDNEYSEILIDLLNEYKTRVV